VEEQKVQFDMEGDRLSLDLFLFNCFNYEQLAKSKRSSMVTPNLVDLELTPASAVGEISTQQIGEIWQKVTSEHQATIKQIAIDFRNLSDYSGCIVELFYNIEKLLPEDREDNALNALVERIVETCFSHLESTSKKLVEFYLRWSLVPIKREAEVVGDRPPVGRFAPAKPRPDRGSKGDRGGRGDKGPSRSDRGPRRDRNSNQKPRPNRDQNRNSKRNDGPPRQRKSEISEADLLKEIIKGCKELRENSNLSEFPLAPQNSYNRRRQHQLIGEEGFGSNSSGDGDNRHVVIVRS